MPALDTRGMVLLGQAMQAFSNRASLESFWQQVAEQFHPVRADFDVTKTPGEDMLSGLYTAEGILFRRDFGNFIGSVLRPKGRKWFGAAVRGIKEKDSVVAKAWLGEMAEAHRDLLYDPRSGFQKSQQVADHDWCTFGNSVTSIEPRSDMMGLRFRSWHLRDVAWKENYDGEIDTVYRRFKITARNLSDQRMRGWDVSQKVVDLVAKSPDTPILCFHIICPVYHYDQKYKGKLEWASLYIDSANKQLMAYKQVPENMYHISRWDAVDGSPYSFSPCVLASMPDSRTLQTMVWSILEAAEKAVEPPTIAKAEAILGGVDLRRGGITYLDSRYDERNGEALRTLELGGQPQVGEVLRQKITDVMNSAWYLNKLFLPQSGPQMTAEEISRRNEEWLRVTQPIIDPAEVERIGTMLDLSFRVALRSNLMQNISPMPGVLRSKNFSYTYSNPVEDARKMTTVYSFNQAVQITTAAMSLDPTTKANLDINKAHRAGLDAVAPPDWTVLDTEAKAAQDQQRQTMQANAAAQQAPDVAGAVKDIAHAHAFAKQPIKAAA